MQQIVVSIWSRHFIHILLHRQRTTASLSLGSSSMSAGKKLANVHSRLALVRWYCNKVMSSPMSRLEDVYKVEVATCFDELAAAKARLARWTAELRSYGVTLSFQFTFPPKSSCSAKLTAVEKAANDARKEVGVRSCRKLRRGPTGGYCLRKDKPNRGGNDCLSPQLAAALASHAFVGTSVTVLDLGAGIGQYGTFFRSHAAASHINYIALDGAENIEESTKGLVRFADLTDGLPRDVRALPRVHWAMSLEVAEHVPRSGEPRFLHAPTAA